MTETTDTTNKALAAKPLSQRMQEIDDANADVDEYDIEIGLAVFRKWVGEVVALEAEASSSTTLLKELEAEVSELFDQWDTDARNSAKKDKNGPTYWLTVELADNHFKKTRILKLIAEKKKEGGKT